MVFHALLSFPSVTFSYRHITCDFILIDGGLLSIPVAHHYLFLSYILIFFPSFLTNLLFFVKEYPTPDGQTPATGLKIELEDKEDERERE